MRVGMFEPPTRDEVTGLDQRGNDSIIGVTLLSLIVDDTATGEARHLFRVEAIGIDRVGDACVDAERRERATLPGPKIEIFATVTGRCVHKTRSGLVGDMLAFEQRHMELVSGNALSQWMRACFDVVRIDAA